MFKKNCHVLPNIISASKKNLSTSTLELPFHKRNELAILDTNMDEMDMSVTSTREMITDFAANNVHMTDNDSQENSSIVPQLTLIFPQSNWLRPNQHHIEGSNASIHGCLNEVSLIPQIVNDSQVSSSGISHNNDKSIDLALIDQTKNSTKIICNAKVSYKNYKPSSDQNPYCLTQPNSKVSTQSDPELNSASLRENVTVDLMTFETFCKQVWFKGIENLQTVTNSKNRKVQTRSKCLRPLRPKTMNIEHENDMDPKFPTKSKLIPSILRKKMMRPSTERSTENLVKSKIDNTQKQNLQCINYTPATKTEGKPSFGSKSTGAVITELPESSAIPTETPSKCWMDLAECKSEDDEGEPDSTIDKLQFMLLKEMWNTRSRNEAQPELADLKLAQNKLFATLLEEFLKKHNCAKYIPQLTGLQEFLKKYNIGVSIEDLNNAVDQSLIKMKIERVIGVKIITPFKSFDYSSTASTNAGQPSEDLQDLKRTLPPRSVKEKEDEKIIEKDKLNVPTLELQADRNHKPIGKRRERISNQKTNRENRKQSSETTNVPQIKTISNNLHATHDFIKCKCNKTSVYKITLCKKKYAIPRCFFNNNFSLNSSLMVREACKLKPKMICQRTHCFASMCNFIKRNRLKQFQKLFLQPMVKLELIRVPNYSNSLNEMLLSNTENLVLSNDTLTTASPVLELENTNSKNNEIIDNITRVVKRVQCNPEVQDDRCYVKSMDNEPICEELVSNSHNIRSNENEVNEITHWNDNNNLLSSPYSSTINDGMDTQPLVCSIGDDLPELTLDEIKVETDLVSSGNAYRTYNGNFYVPNFNFYASVGPEETRKIVETPKRIAITSDNYGPMNSFYIISTPQWAPKSSGSQENCNDVMSHTESLEMKNQHLWVDNDRSIPFDTLSPSKLCRKHGETTVDTSVGSPTDIPEFNQTIIVNVQNHDSRQNQCNGTLTPLSLYNSNLNLGADKSTPFIYDLTPHIIRTQDTVDRNKKIPITLKRKIAPRPPNNLVPNESLSTTVKKSRTTIQSTPVRWHTKSNHTITKQSKNNIATEQPKQFIKMNMPRITSGVHVVNSSVGNKDTMKSVRKERPKRHYKTIKINNKMIQKTNNREIVAAESTTENNEPTLNLRITSSTSKDVTEPTLKNHDRSDEDWYDGKEDNESNLKQEYDFQNELYNRYFINLLKANGYHAKFRYSNTRLAVLSANISNLERAEKFVQTFEKFDSADYLIWRDAKQERYLLHRTWLCAKNGEQKPNVAYENLPCQARIHISIRRAPSNTHNADVLIYKEHSHVS